MIEMDRPGERRSKRVSLREMALAAVMATSILCAACSSGPERPVANLAPGFEPLRAAFNADAGKVRLLLLLDPT